MTVTTSELKKGLTIMLEGEMYKVTDWSHNKQGRGSANVRLQLKNLRTGSNIERTFQAGAKFDDVRLDRRELQFMYSDGDEYHFMDPETYEQVSLRADMLGDAVNYLKDGMEFELLMYEDEPVGLEMPLNVVLEVTRTDPGFKGDTATGGNKPATLETGLTINVPLFVSTGDKIRVDTRDGSYIERV